MKKCHQKLGIFTLKQCQNKGVKECDHCKQYFCDTHFMEEGVCKTCYNILKDDQSLMEGNAWYWKIQHLTNTMHTPSNLYYSRMIHSNNDIIMDEFDQQEYVESDEFDEADMSFFDS